MGPHRCDSQRHVACSTVPGCSRRACNLEVYPRASPPPAPAQPGKNEPPSAWGWAKKLSSNPYVIAILIAVGVFLLYEIARKILCPPRVSESRSRSDQEFEALNGSLFASAQRSEKVAVSKTTSDTPADVASASTGKSQ